MRISDWSSDVCSSDLVGARRGLAVGAEAHQAPAMAEAAGEDVLVADLGHQLGPQRLPGEVLLGVPAAHPAGHSPGLGGVGLVLGPALPRVAPAGLLPPGPQPVHPPTPSGGVDAAPHPPRFPLPPPPPEAPPPR